MIGLVWIKSSELSEKLVSSLEGDDNSRVMHGKKDYKKGAKRVSKQNRILNNYLRSLYLKFISEDLNIKISLPFFFLWEGGRGGGGCFCFYASNTCVFSKLHF